MSNHRLKLNWSLAYKDERTDFVQSYLKDFSNPSPDELDTIAKYILWGKTRSTNLTGPQEGLELESAHRTWKPKRTASLEALLDSPIFSETELLRAQQAPYHVAKPSLNRNEVRVQAPPFFLKEFEKLWGRIDRADYTIGYAEFVKGKRQNPPRDSLRACLEDKERLALEAKALTIGDAELMGLKHQLVQLRREQYTLRDMYKPPVLISRLRYKFQVPILEEEPVAWGTEICVKPLFIGRLEDAGLRAKIFGGTYPEPQNFGKDELKALGTILWEKKPFIHCFDFGDIGMLAEFNAAREHLENKEALGNVEEILEIWDALEKLADLAPEHKIILDLKGKKKTNQYVVAELVKNGFKRYSTNYISTLYYGKCLGRIAHAARRLRETAENLFFKENFKTCIDCGKTLLRDSENFARKKSTVDELEPRCKKCAKIKRDKRRLGKNGN